MMKTTSVTTCAAMAAILMAGMAVAAVTSDYFEYGDTNGTLVGLTTANTAGWGASGWSGGNNPYYQTNELTFSTPNDVYVNTQVAGRVIGQQTGGTVTRTLSPPLDGTTVWMSIVFSGSFWNASPGVQQIRILINGDTNDYFGVMSNANLVTGVWQVAVNGAWTTQSFVGLVNVGGSGNGGGLMVARLRTDYSGTDDSLAFWLLTNGFPLANATVAALGTPLYETNATFDIWGSSISSLGIYIKSARNENDPNPRWFWVDSLRISSGTMSDDDHVYEIVTGVVVPEPGAVMLGLAGLLGVVRRSRKQV